MNKIQLDSLTKKEKTQGFSEKQFKCLTLVLQLQGQQWSSDKAVAIDFLTVA
jgi:hypothetical protein